MNKKNTFSKNFDQAIIALTKCAENEQNKFIYQLRPINEDIGKTSSKDIWMMNAVLKNNGIDEPKNYLDSIRIMSAGRSKYPLWIKISQINEKLLQLEFSTRFRHIKNCHNQQTGYPPFEIVV